LIEFVGEGLQFLRVVNFEIHYFRLQGLLHFLCQSQLVLQLLLSLQELVVVSCLLDILIVEWVDSPLTQWVLLLLILIVFIEVVFDQTNYIP